MPVPRPESIRFIWEQAEKRLAAQIQQADALDTKAGVLLGVLTLAAGLAGSLVPQIEGAGRWIALVAMVGLVLSGWFAFRAFRAQEYDRSPGPEEMWAFADWTDEQIQLRFLSTRFRSIRENREKLRRKAGNLFWSLFSLGVLALILAGSAMENLIQ